MTTPQALRDGHHAASGVENDADPVIPVTDALEAYYKKHETLRGLPPAVIRKAWFTMAHLLLTPGSKVVDIGCHPQMTYVMALLNPQITFIGIDAGKKLIRDAQKKYAAPNLEFREDDIASPQSFDPHSVDAVINSFILHEIYSAQRYSDRPVVNALERHFSILKQEGLMLIRDYAMQPPDEFVLLEMPDKDGGGETPEDMAEADLLVWYSEHARPRKNRSFDGFFLEELPARFPQTRLFRLPYKWAYEFVMRKDDRKALSEELDKEYTFFTPRDYRKNLGALGSRVLYTAPQWDDALIREKFDGRFRMYSDEGKALSAPPTSFIAVAQKMGEKKSLQLNERRPSVAAESQIRITAMRNDANGRIFDVVSRDMDVTEILPYRVTPEGELNIFIHEGLPRGIANAVPRTGKTIDGKNWSGHMVEAITVPTDIVYETEAGEPKATVLFARDYLGLKPGMGCLLEPGKPFYPAPDFIDEQIKTRYLRVLEHEGVIEPKRVTKDFEGFTTKGRIREVGAQSILNAISVGYIPNFRLELQILDLYKKLGMTAETWSESPLALDEGEISEEMDLVKFLGDMSGKDNRFKTIKGTAGQVRTVKSTFVEEGWIEGGIEGLSSRDMEFVIADDQTINKAVILPLTKHVKTGKVMAGLQTEFMPVPQRHQGNGLTLKAPTITLPKEIVSIEQAKRFIAEQFEVPPEKVARMGESYFCHLGVTPVRIFPFCVATTGQSRTPLGGPFQYAPMKAVWKIIDKFDCYNHTHMMLYINYRKIGMREAGTEVMGDWVRSSHRLNEELHQSAAAIINSSHAMGYEAAGRGEAPASATPAVPAAAPVVTSPDFADIKTSDSAEAAAFAAKQKAANSNSPGNDPQFNTK